MSITINHETNDISSTGGDITLGGAAPTLVVDNRGEAIYTTPGTYSWVAPADVTSVSVVAIGGGGGYYGGGAGLGWSNNISVVPGSSYTVVVAPVATSGNAGSASSFNGNTTRGEGGMYNSRAATDARAGYTGDGGGNGGIHFTGGAGGYTGNGGDNGAAPAGGGGGGGNSAYTGGGGVGIYGEGASGSAVGLGGSGGGNSYQTDGDTSKLRHGGHYGGGGAFQGNGGSGAVRIIWGDTMSFPDNAPSLS